MAPGSADCFNKKQMRVGANVDSLLALATIILLFCEECGVRLVSTCLRNDV